jgi:hypothetical protein
MAKNEPQTTSIESTDQAAKADRDIAARYGALETSVEKAEQAFGDIKRLAREQATEAEVVAEARRREQDKALYDMNAERQKVKDQHAREDADRETKFKEREAATRAAEDELLSLLKVQRDPNGKVPAGKIIRDAFEARIAEAEKAAEGKGKAIAEKEAKAAAELEKAKGATELALLKQENAQLKTQNETLGTHNRELLAKQNEVVGHMKEVADGAFKAAGGVVAQGNAALGTAAGGAGQGKRPGFPG